MRSGRRQKWKKGIREILYLSIFANSFKTSLLLNCTFIKWHLFQGECERWLHRTRPSHRLHRCAHPCHAHPRAQQAWRKERCRGIVHRRWYGNRDVRRNLVEEDDINNNSKGNNDLTARLLKIYIMLFILVVQKSNNYFKEEKYLHLSCILNI